MASSSSNDKQSGITHNCGVFACIASGPWPTELEISQIICFGLVALQHRGQESAGIVTSYGKRNEKLNIHRGMGLVSNVFDTQSMGRLKGNLGIGHTRYSTSACSDFINTQPFVVHTQYGSLAMAHNGQLVNDSALRKKVLSGGVGLSTESDSELITQALCLNPPGVEFDGKVDWPARIKNLMKLSPLSYSLVLMHGDRIYGVRDPYGNRPLCIGKLISVNKNGTEGLNGHSNGKVDDEKPDGWVISSESSGFLSIGARYLREVKPGEIVEITKNGIESLGIVERPKDKLPALCIFEYVYFARPDTILEDQTVYGVRFESGRQLAIEAPCDADIVSSVPESGNAAAHGFAQKSGIQYAEVFCKNRYVGRSFIQPSTRMRQRSVAMKFGPIGSNVEGKRIVLIDDSIVRGNTIGPIIAVLRDAGAKEVHIRIASPPVKYPCYMGINIPTRDELIANKYNAKELEERFGANSLRYLSINGLVSAVTIKHGKKEPEKSGHCSACLTGIYPEKLEW